MFPEDAGLVDVTDYGATGDGRTDDTMALQRAITDNVGRHRILYFPPGVYVVSDALEWRDSERNWQPQLTLQGAGRDHTTIRLIDRAPGFGDPAEPRGVIITASALFDDDPYTGGKDYPGLGEGNQAFRNYVFDLTVDTGADNEGAIGVDFLGNNSNGIENVTIRSADMTGRAGLSMTRKWPGPSLIKNLEVIGFDYGIEAAGTEYGITFEDIVLRDQQVAGILNTGNVLSMHRVTSINQVPAIRNESPLGMVVAVDGSFQGGARGTSAIENSGAVYLRSMAAEGYSSLLLGLAGHYIDEYATPLTDTLGGSSLMLPIEDPPAVDRFEPLDSWTAVTDPAHAGGADPTDDADDTAAIQAAFDSGAPVVYFPASTASRGGRYLVSKTLVVPATVERIVGFNSLMLGANGSTFTRPSASQGVFRVDGSTDAGLRVEGLRMAPEQEPLIGAVWFDHYSSRSVTLSHTLTSTDAALTYRGRPGAGPVFLEDVCCGSLQLGSDQQVWARQLNVEKRASPMITNEGARLWVMGIKSELPETVIASAGGSSSEILGGLLYPVEPVPRGTPAFIESDASGSYVYAVSAYIEESRNYRVHVVSAAGELSVGQTVARNLGSLIPLYVAEG